MKTHELKIWPEHYADVVAGVKTAEVRLNDRGYNVGDLLALREWVPASGDYTGRVTFRVVQHILGMPAVTARHDGAYYSYVVMSITEASKSVALSALVSLRWPLPDGWKVSGRFWTRDDWSVWKCTPDSATVERWGAMKRSLTFTEAAVSRAAAMSVADWDDEHARKCTLANTHLLIKAHPAVCNCEASR